MSEGRRNDKDLYVDMLKRISEGVKAHEGQFCIPPYLLVSLREMIRFSETGMCPHSYSHHLGSTCKTCGQVG